MTRSRDSVLKELEDRLRFETLLAEISVRFVNLPGDRLDSEIEETQRRICEFLNLDRSTLWEVPEGEPGTLLLTHLYQPPGSRPPAERMKAKDFFPWTTQKVLGGQTVIISKITELPPKADRDRESYRFYGTKSNVVLPLSVGGGQVFGLLSFAVMREERSWPDTAVRGFNLIAQVFANALARRRDGEALRESEARLKLAAESAKAGLWGTELDTGRVWVTARTRELFGFAADEELSYESFFDVIHPEDRDQVRQAMQRTDDAGESFWIDYRIVRPNESVRWIGSRGQIHCKSSGEPNRIMGVSVDITERKQAEESLRKAYEEIKRLKDQMETENIYLRGEVYGENIYEHIIGQSELLRRVLHRVEQVAPTDAIVLLTGETGTGKELIAEAIHDRSKRKERLLVKVNCAALPAALVENELFGREKGAYTGALSKQIGRFELADHSTLFLDEITELPLDVQAKLLRVLQKGEFERLGSPKTIRTDVRLIAATNLDLAAEVERGTFRKDLYYRLNVFPIVVPPLRERPEDIPLLVQAFVREFSGKMGKKVPTVSSKSMDALQRYQWPGNIRELRNVIEHAVIVSAGNILTVQVPQGPEEAVSKTLTMGALEYQHIMDMLKATGWRIKGPRGAAKLLGMKPSTLYAKMQRLGISTRTEKDRGMT